MSNNRIIVIEDYITDISNNRITAIEDDITDMSNNRIKDIEDAAEKPLYYYILELIKNV